MPCVGRMFIVLVSISFLAAPVFAVPKQRKSVDAILAEMGAEQVRSVHSDIAFPITSEEYEKVGKNAILMLEASSVSETELPLRSAFLLRKGLKIPLRRIALFDKQATTNQGKTKAKHTEQVSFYLVPIMLLKTRTHLGVDFQSQRTDFNVSDVGPVGRDDPSFLSLDQHDSAHEPDVSAL